MAVRLLVNRALRKHYRLELNISAIDKIAILVISITRGGPSSCLQEAL